MSAVQIGWYNLKEDKVFYDNSYECAAWYENIAVKAGKYPVTVYDYRVRDDGKIQGHVSGVYVTFEGTVVNDYFGSLYCGVPIGTYDCEKNKGKKSRYTMHSYFYSVADSILNNPDTPYELFPEYVAEPYTFISSIDGEEVTTHVIRYVGCADKTE